MTLEVPRGGRQPSQVAAARQAVALQRLSGATTPGGSRAQGLISTAAGLALPGAPPSGGVGGVIASGAYSVPTSADTFDGFYLVLQDGPFNEVGSIEDYITLGGDGSIQVLQASWFQVQANLAVGLGGSFASKAVYGGCDLPQLSGYSLNNGIHGSATTDSGGVAKWTTTSLPFYCNPGYDATIRAWAAGNDSLLSAGQNVYGNVFVAVLSGSAP